MVLRHLLETPAEGTKRPQTRSSEGPVQTVHTQIDGVDSYREAGVEPPPHERHHVPLLLFRWPGRNMVLHKTRHISSNQCSAGQIYMTKRRAFLQWICYKDSSQLEGPNWWDHIIIPLVN